MPRARRPGTYFLVLIALLTGCSKDLSRSRAADLIKTQKDFSAAMEVKVPVGNTWWDWRNLSSGELKALQDRGILSVRESGQKSGYWSREYLAELTPLGKDLSKSWVATKETLPSGAPYMESRCWTVFGQGEPCHESKGVVYSVVLAQRRINQVTGITADDGGKDSAAEFTWEWVPTANAKPFADRVRSGAHTGQAEFELYDDGWRITKIELP